MVISPTLLLVIFVAYVVTQAQAYPKYPAWNPDYVRMQRSRKLPRSLFASSASDHFLFSPFLKEHFPETEAKLYPDWVFGIIILLCALPVISIPLVALYHLICSRVRKSSTHVDLNPYTNDVCES